VQLALFDPDPDREPDAQFAQMAAQPGIGQGQLPVAGGDLRVRLLLRQDR
jgi:hypothetical protein